MGHVVVVVVVVLDFKTFTHISRDPTLKKVMTRRQDLSDIGTDFAYKTFFGVGSLDFQGSKLIQPRRKS